ncbi:hypothetical protein OS493_035047 [Desmophyllum pertusum]|uniref:Rhodanese domain-containing protein n=1 Tax=Desmophyllum pertusum TaxID=174260 RepID=A0A9W9ZWT0_9CNID|nr:hypothetical protein OS493_035047 [Desmophyllum pertusum]
MSFQSSRPEIVSTDWLDKELKANKSDLQVLDATWFPDKNASEDFAKQHIMHASYMDMFLGVQNTPLLPRNIPDVPTFQMNARGSAVNNSNHVVIYENVPGFFGYFMGARAWWMFKLFGHENVSVLDGGLARWIGDGKETTDMMAKKKEGDFTAKYTPKWIRKFEDMKENLTSHKAQVCDSRGPALFNHSKDDPKTGHYPGAVNIPYPSLFNPDTKTLKTVDELKKVYADAGIDLKKPVIGMCIGGMSSCTLVLTAHMCGCPDVALYHGGFTEWKGRADPSQIE